MKDAFCTPTLEMPTRLMVSAIEKAKPQSLVEKYLWDLNKTSVTCVSRFKELVIRATCRSLPLLNL